MNALPQPLLRATSGGTLRLALAATLFAALIALPAAAQNVVPSQIVIKLRPAAHTTFEASRRDAGRASALPALDAVGRSVGAVEVRPVLPPSRRFADRHRASGMDRWYVVTFNRSLAPAAAAAAYAALGAVEKAEVQYERRLFDAERVGPPAGPMRTAGSAAPPPVNDPLYPQQWHYDNTGQHPGSVADADIDLPEAWATGYNGDGVVVAVMDSGSDLDHPDLAANLWVNTGETPGNGIDDDGNGYADDVYGIDPVNGDSNPNDDNDHGTHTAGTIAAVTNNGVGVAGVAPEARIMSLKICTAGGGCPSDVAIAASFVYAADMGAAIASNSWGGGDSNALIEDAIQYFNANGGGGLLTGGLTIFANGNSNTDCVGSSANGGCGWPAELPYVVAVAATGFTNARAFYSDYGVGTDLSAPGGDRLLLDPQGRVLSTVIDGYDWFNGTSMACPHVSGVAALVVQANVGQTPTFIRTRLTSTAAPFNDPLFTAGKMGSGLVNAAAALAGAGPPPPPAPPAVASVSPLSFSVTVAPGASTTANLTVRNTAAPGARLLAWSAGIAFPFSLAPTPPEAAASSARGVAEAPALKGDGTADGGGSVSLAGGPDTFGYFWRDSNEPGGPTYAWTDISAIGTPGPTGDDASAVVPLPFTFPFYGVDRTSVTMSTNGVLSFGAPGAAFGNTGLPNAAAPNDLVAPFWDDLNVTAAGQTDTYHDAANNRFIVQWTNASRFEGVGAYTFQAVIYPDGAIEYHYDSMAGVLNSATVGIENGTGTVGLQVAANAPYVANGLAVRFETLTIWATIAPASGFVAGGASQAPVVTFDATDLGPGTYTATLNVTTNDPANPSYAIPLQLVVANPNTPPVANSGPDQTVVAGQTVTLDGSGSSDPDGDPLTFAWTLTPSGTLSSATAVGPTFCAAAAGVYTATLVVNDGTVDSGPDDATVTAISATAALDALAARVAALRASGVLTKGQASGLTQKVNQARREVVRGRPAQAGVHLGDFAAQVASLQASGVLTEAQAAVLTDASSALRAALTAPCTAAPALATVKAGPEAGVGLGAAYPNPSSGRVTVPYGLADAAHVRLALYDALGREVAVLVDAVVETGAHEAALGASSLPAGVYVVRLTTDGGLDQTHRITLLR